MNDVPLIRSGPELADEPYSFLFTTEDGSPIRWNPSEPIRWVINFESDVDRDGQWAVTNEAVERVSEATGIEFRYEGTTTEPPSPNRPVVVSGRWRPLLIAWVAAGHQSLIAGGGQRDCGAGGPEYVASSFREPVYVTGQAAIQAPSASRSAGWSRSDSLHVILHELGHVMGLGHVTDQREVMAPTSLIGSMAGEYGQGDLEGLRLLAAGQGPLWPPSPREFEVWMSHQDAPVPVDDSIGSRSASERRSTRRTRLRREPDRYRTSNG